MYWKKQNIVQIDKMYFYLIFNIQGDNLPELLITVHIKSLHFSVWKHDYVINMRTVYNSGVWRL